MTTSHRRHRSLANTLVTTPNPAEAFAPKLRRNIDYASMMMAVVLVVILGCLGFVIYAAVTGQFPTSGQQTNGVHEPVIVPIVPYVPAGDE